MAKSSTKKNVTSVGEVVEQVTIAARGVARVAKAAVGAAKEVLTHDGKDAATGVRAAAKKAGGKVKRKAKAAAGKAKKAGSSAKKKLAGAAKKAKTGAKKVAAAAKSATKKATKRGNAKKR